MVATSYPRNAADWQGLFIRKIADAMGADPALTVSLWAPDGPRHAQVDYACSAADGQWLDALAERGGMAHLLRTSPVVALGAAGSLLHRLRGLYQARVASTDLFHINWLQNALPLHGMGVKAVVTVLGTDFKLLRLPGMVALIRRVLQSNDCILAPNASWMEQPLREYFGDVATGAAGELRYRRGVVPGRVPATGAGQSLAVRSAGHPGQDRQAVRVGRAGI